MSHLSGVEVIRPILHGIGLTALFWAWGALEARAMEYHAHGLFGLYQAKEVLQGGGSGEESNDQMAYLGRVYLDAKRIGDTKAQFTVDVRDRYDAYGAVDRDRPRLVPSDEAQVRQLALKFPAEDGKFSAALGRVPIADAALMANDGVDLAYRTTPRFRVGVFGGLYPELRYGRQPSLADEVPQVGTYGIYDDKSDGWQKHTLVTYALVSRTPPKDRDEGATPAAGVSSSNSNSGAENPTLYWFSNAVFQVSPETRYTALTQFDLAPKISARNVWLGWSKIASPKIMTTASLIRIDPTGYNRQRDALDQLPPSVLTRAQADGRFRIDSRWSILADGAYGIRSADQKYRMELGARALLSGLMKGRLSVYGGGGGRRNYVSDDTIGRAGLGFVFKGMDLALHQQIVLQARDNGTREQSYVTDLSGSALIGDNLMGTLTLEYARGRQATQMSGMAGLGFRVGSGQMTPVGPNPPPPLPVERL